MLRPAELVEDELILAVPVVPVMPGTEAMERDWPAQEEEKEQASPFAALAGAEDRQNDESRVKRTRSATTNLELKLEQSHGCAEVPRFPVPQGMRRAHDALSAKQLSTDPTTR